MSVHCVHCDADCGDDHRAGNGLPQTEHYGSDGSAWRAENCPACHIDTQTPMVVTKAETPDPNPASTIAYRVEARDRSAVITTSGTVHVWAHSRTDDFDGLTEWATYAAAELRAALAGEAS